MIVFISDWKIANIEIKDLMITACYIVVHDWRSNGDTYILPENCLFRANSKEGYGYENACTGKVKFCKGQVPLIVAVDIGMEMNHGYCNYSDGRDLRPFKVDNTRRDGELWGMVMGARNRSSMQKRWLSDTNQTGPYGEPMVNIPDRKAVIDSSG